MAFEVFMILGIILLGLIPLAGFYFGFKHGGKLIQKYIENKDKK